MSEDFVPPEQLLEAEFARQVAALKAEYALAETWRQRLRIRRRMRRLQRRSFNRQITQW